MDEFRRARSEQRGMAVAHAFEIKTRRADVVDISAGRSAELSEFFSSRGLVAPRPPSADLISHTQGDNRLIEVKARGGSGPIEIIERQLATFDAAPELAWLYVVWNTTQPQPVQLWLIRDPRRLPWTKVQDATRTPDQPRGTRHEARFVVPSDAVHAVGEQQPVSHLGLPSWAGASRD